MVERTESKQSGRFGEDSSVFLHRSVADALRHKVRKGILPGGAKLPTLREMASEFQVSTMTVRQAIRRLEEEGHVYRISGVGAFVRPSDPTKLSKAKMLAFVAMDLSAAFDMSVARGIERATQQRGWSLQILDAHLDVELETRNMLRLPHSGARGAIVLPPWNPENVEALLRIQSEDFPLVLVDRTLPGLKSDLVESDHELGAFRAVTHLLDRGHSRVMIVTHEQGVSSVDARIRGYRRAMHSRGIEPDPEWTGYIDGKTQRLGFEQNKRWLGGCEAARPVLQQMKMPCAAFAIDAYTTWGIYEACHQLGLRIPEDVSVIGFDDSELAHAMRPPTTIMSQRTDEIGRVAVELLERRLDQVGVDGHRKQFTHVVVDVDLVERESVAKVDSD